MADQVYFAGRKTKERWQDLAINPQRSIREVIEFIDHQARQIALVVDENNHFVGTITDGDIRRGILKGMNLSEPCHSIMNKKPTSFSAKSPREDIIRTMKNKGLRHIPLLDDQGCILDLVTLDDILSAYRHDNPVVIMAGGMGKRLGALTQDTPKPMLEVGGRPILETILGNFIDQGFHRFYFSVNYLSKTIKDYFQSGKKWNVDIQYLEEDQPLGTAGSLHLIPDPSQLPFIVMNGDLLTNVNINNLLQFHRDSRSHATMCVREFVLEVPYGVVHTEGHQLLRIEEKPSHKFFVNAGIYVLNPDALSLIPHRQFFNMTTLFEKMISLKRSTSTFPIHEYWKDIGQLPDFHSANHEFSQFFKVTP